MTAVIARRSRKRRTEFDGSVLGNLVGNFSDKAALHISACRAVEHTLTSINEIQFFPRSGNTHIRKATLLLHILLGIKALRSGKNSLLKSRYENNRELQSLCGVERHQNNAVLVRIIRINIGHKSNVLKK